jgi:hypothetical protein
MLTMCLHNRKFMVCDKWILGKRLYKERQIGTPYWVVVRKNLLVLKSCVDTRMKQSQSKVCGYQPQPYVVVGPNKQKQPTREPTRGERRTDR